MFSFAARVGWSYSRGILQNQLNFLPTVCYYWCPRGYHPNQLNQLAGEKETFHQSFLCFSAAAANLVLRSVWHRRFDFFIWFFFFLGSEANGSAHSVGFAGWNVKVTICSRSEVSSQTKQGCRQHLSLHGPFNIRFWVGHKDTSRGRFRGPADRCWLV